MNEKYRYPFAVKKIRDDCKTCQKYIKYGSVFVVLPELTNHCCTVVEAKRYSPDGQLLKLQRYSNAL